MHSDRVQVATIYTQRSWRLHGRRAGVYHVKGAYQLQRDSRLDRHGRQRELDMDLVTSDQCRVFMSPMISSNGEKRKYQF